MKSGKPKPNNNLDPNHIKELMNLRLSTRSAPPEDCNPTPTPTYSTDISQSQTNILPFPMMNMMSNQQPNSQLTFQPISFSKNNLLLMQQSMQQRSISNLQQTLQPNLQRKIPHNIPQNIPQNIQQSFQPKLSQNYVLPNIHLSYVPSTSTPSPSPSSNLLSNNSNNINNNNNNNSSNNLSAQFSLNSLYSNLLALQTTPFLKQTNLNSLKNKNTNNTNSKYCDHKNQATPEFYREQRVTTPSRRIDETSNKLNKNILNGVKDDNNNNVNNVNIESTKYNITQNINISSSSSNNSLNSNSNSKNYENKTQLFKTELCTNYTLTHTCSYGNKCHFAHGRQDLRPRYRSENYKTQMCCDPARSGPRRCMYGSRCNYCHPGEALRKSFNGQYYDKDYFKQIEKEYGKNDFPLGIYI